MENKETILSIARAICPDFETYEHRNQLSLIIPRECLIDIATELKDNPETYFDMLLDITAIDWYRPQDRFEVVYFLYSNKFKNRVRLKVKIQERHPECPSVTGIWESANWYERETYDMYGIRFENHPNLRRFYLPEDFVDPDSGEPIYPLRKDFPLMGVPGSLPLPPYPEREKNF